MSAHRYWRLNFITDNGGSALTTAYTALAELQLCTAGGTNRVGTGTPAASSFFSGLPASQAFDGNINTWWACNGPANPTWLSYDFGAGNTWDIQQVVLTCRNDGSYGAQSPTEFYVQYSDDNVSWTNYWYVPPSQVAAWSQGSSQTFLFTLTLALTGVAITTLVAHVGGDAPASGLFSLRPATAGTTPSGPAKRLGDPHVFGNREYSPAAAKTTVSGTVSVLGVATGGLLVRAYSKKTSDLLGQTTSAGDGTYSIECGGSADVYVVAFDPTTYQALVYDEVVPG